MQTYDIIMLIVLGATTFIGFRKGLAWQLASVAAIVASYVVAVQFRDVLAQHIDAQPPWNTFLAMLILYIGTSFVIWLMFQLVRGMIDRAKLREFDQQLGAIFGLAKGVLLCVIITLFAVTLLDDQKRQQIIGSRSGLYIAQLLDRAHAVMPEELHELLHPYLHRLDDPSAPPEPDEFQRLEDWLEKGQGRGTWDGRASSAASDDFDRPSAIDVFRGFQSTPAYQAERDPRRRQLAPQ
jgi:membrane protein required for colicin V production